MYQINDLVIYRNIGVCKVVDISYREQFGTSGNYYTLKPMNDDKSTVFVNVENKKVMMRYLLSPEKIENIVEHIEEIEGYSCENDRERDAHYKELINSGETTKWIQVIKGLYRRKLDRNKKGKELSQQEERLFKLAEKLFYGEVSYALEMPQDEVKGYIEEHVGHKI